jgi:endonuclease YncB( thermonuclease family)
MTTARALAIVLLVGIVACTADDAPQEPAGTTDDPDMEEVVFTLPRTPAQRNAQSEPPAPASGPAGLGQPAVLAGSAPPAAGARPGPRQPLGLRGVPRIVDGDTLEVAGETVRLTGVDAFEADQVCRDRRGETYRCGAVAAEDLRAWLDQQFVTCWPEDRDGYGLPIALCEADGTDVGAWLVVRGHALAQRQHGNRYLQLEQEAQANGAGAWRGSFDAPWHWRDGTGVLVR